jgi:hypothetical protein
MLYNVYVKGTLARDFGLLFFSLKASLWDLITTLVHFRIQIQIRRDIRIRRSFRVLSEYGKLNFFVMQEYY